MRREEQGDVLGSQTEKKSGEATGLFTHFEIQRVELTSCKVNTALLHYNTSADSILHHLLPRQLQTVEFCERHAHRLRAKCAPACGHPFPVINMRCLGNMLLHKHDNLHDIHNTNMVRHNTNMTHHNTT